MYLGLNDMKIFMSSFIILLVLFPKNSCGTERSKDVDDVSDSKKAEALFRRLYKLERVEQLAAVKALLKMGREDKQAKMVHAIADKVFGVIQKSRIILESSGYIPGFSEFPIDERTRDALSNVLENTAFFGDILMRLPDITEAMLHSNTEWNNLLQWCLIFTNQTNLLDSKTITLIDLVSQEMNYTKRNQNFSNPYRKKITTFKPAIPAPEVTSKKKVKKRKTLPRGPRLSGSQVGEL